MTGLDEAPVDAVSGALCLCCNRTWLFADEGSFWLLIWRRRVPAGRGGRRRRRFGAHAARAQLPIGTVYVLARCSWNFICTPDAAASSRKPPSSHNQEYNLYLLSCRLSIACLCASFLLRSICLFHSTLHRNILWNYSVELNSNDKIGKLMKKKKAMNDTTKAVTGIPLVTVHFYFVTFRLRCSTVYDLHSNSLLWCFVGIASVTSL